jgi:hypothetical protein
MAERSRSGGGRSTAGKASTRSRSSGSAASAPREEGRTQARRAGQNELSAADAVSRARKALSELTGRPVEGVLGVDRDHGNWIATVQVVELARVPNTTDVLGEYETVLDGKGELVRYHRRRRYHRGQVDGSQQ